MSEVVTGRCACGGLTYEATEPPSMGLHCHCLDCQRATGSGHASVAIFPRTAIAVRGAVKYHSVQTDSGHTARRGFCPECGSPVLAEPGVVAHLVGVFAASLDDPSLFKPQFVLYTKRSHAWDSVDEALPAFEAMPPPAAAAG